MIPKIITLFLLLLGVSLWGRADAHPTSFKGSLMTEGYFQPSMQSTKVIYSWDYWFATAVGQSHFKQGAYKDQAYYGSANFLVKRWNAEHSQANFYVMPGMGTYIHQDKAYRMETLGTMFDYETRRIYTAWWADYKHSDQGRLSRLDATARVGVAPYLANFNELNTWLILQVQHMPQAHVPGQPEWMVTPMLRFFYKNVLWEVGSSTQGDFSFNFMINF